MMADRVSRSDRLIAQLDALPRPDRRAVLRYLSREDRARVKQLARETRKRKGKAGKEASGSVSGLRGKSPYSPKLSKHLARLLDGSVPEDGHDVTEATRALLQRLLADPAPVNDNVSETDSGNRFRATGSNPAPGRLASRAAG